MIDVPCSHKPQQAPGAPGIEPHWTTSRKQGVGTARGLASHVWFAISHGIVGEVFYPRVDRPAVKELGLIVTGDDFYSDERSDAGSEVSWIASGVPGYRLRNTCRQRRYVVEKTVIVDPWRHTLLQQTRFAALQGDRSDYRLFVNLAPRLGDRGSENSGRLGEFKGLPLLFAEIPGCALALACSRPWVCRTVGFAGESDGQEDLRAHGQLHHLYDVAECGNVSLTGEIDLGDSADFVLAVGFGRNASEAGHRARASLEQGFEAACNSFLHEWSDWHESLDPPNYVDPQANALCRTDAAVLATHESKDFSGGIIASLALPWGEIHGDKDAGGYHLVWPRDACESSAALLALGTSDQVLRAMEFFAVTQESCGHWPQNMWLDGTKFGDNIQLDEVAAPILLFDLAKRCERLSTADCERFWPMVRHAACYIAQHGPCTAADRWEEEAGITPYTLAAMIAALLAVAEYAENSGDSDLAQSLRETADAWNASIERWLYVEGTELARQVGVPGYYVRLVPPSSLKRATSITDEKIKIPNSQHGVEWFPASQIVSADALALVRFGLRAADDPRMIDTVRVIDAMLKVETPSGPCWHRYNHDGYGEHNDGSPYDGAGVGRAWPLLTGERAHFELAAGRTEEAHRLLLAMTAMASATGLLPEQIWDADDIPAMELYAGRPSGSARPLVWAHAERIKLTRSLHDGKVFDMPPQTVSRYLNKGRETT